MLFIVKFVMTRVRELMGIVTLPYPTESAAVAAAANETTFSFVTPFCRDRLFSFVTPTAFFRIVMRS